MYWCDFIAGWVGGKFLKKYSSRRLGTFHFSKRDKVKYLRKLIQDVPELWLATHSTH